jgi:hypothetical protein
VTRSMRVPMPGACVVALSLALVLACDGRVHRVERVSAEEALLLRRIEGLRALIGAARRAPLGQFDQALIVVDERLVDDLLKAAMPLERVLGDRYRITLDRADVDFEDGFALVTLDGRAGLAEDPRTFADLKIYSGLDIVELDRTSGTLRGRMKIIAVDVRRVDVKGLTAPLQRLVEDFGRGKLADFEALLSSVEIPVRVRREIEIPGVGPEGGVTIAPLTVPLRASIESVKAFRGKLWISVGASAGAGARP